jgi:hypothetical protein
MAIDPNNETLISLADATRLLPARRKGRKPHLSCIYRWTVSGCRGVILESIQVGGTRCTSKEALARFLEALTLASPTGHHASLRSPVKRRRAAGRSGRPAETPPAQGSVPSGTTKARGVEQGPQPIA